MARFRHLLLLLLASVVSGLQIEDTALIKAAADSNLDKRSYYGD